MEEENSRESYSKRKLIFLLLHFLALFILVVGVGLIYTNDNFSKGIFWMNSGNFEDSKAFVATFDSAIRDVFTYTNYQDMFETDDKIDLKKPVFSINLGPGENNVYTIADVFNYAKKRGFYLDEDLKAAASDDVVRNTETQKDDKSYLVNWKAYSDQRQVKGPGDDYVTKDDLVREALDHIGRYLRAYKIFKGDPTNIKYRLDYGDGQMVYTNAKAMSMEDIKSIGRYASLDSDSIVIDTNLVKVPDDMLYLADQAANLKMDTYNITIAVDTSYSAKDNFYLANLRYAQQRNWYFYSIVIVALAGMGMLATLWGMTKISGIPYYGASSRITYRFDRIGVETNVLICLVVIVFLSFLSDKVIIQMIQVFIPRGRLNFVRKMLHFLGGYLCIFYTYFSIIRAIRAGILWKNSFIKHVKDELGVYTETQTFMRSLSKNYIAFCCVNIFGTAIAIYLFIKDISLIARIVGFLLMICLLFLDCIYFHKLYKNALQREFIAKAIKRISDGNTDYHLEIEAFDGKEAVLAENLNHISHGLEIAIGEQVKSERMKADLITNVSHDIKTPLTSIINYVALIKREKPSDPKICEYLNILDVKSQHLKNLTEDLVEASKASSGNISLEMGPLDFVELVQQSNGEFEEKYEERKLSIVSELPTDQMMILADGRRLWRVLENLYNNAYKYAAFGSRVYVEMTHKGKMAVFTMKNISANPLNIRPDELTERFVRGDVSRTTEGSGLGLSIATSLTKLQGGEFEILIDGDLFKAVLSFPLMDENS